MEFAYAYKATSRQGLKVNGVVTAEDMDTVYAKLATNGYRAEDVRIDIGNSLHHFLSPDFDKKELARFYRTIGRRLKNGRSLTDGLAGASEYVRDVRLKQAAVTMRLQILEGHPEADAMLIAGLPKRDAMIIRSSGQTGKTGESFLMLADEVERKHALAKSIKSTFMMPVFMTAMLYALFYGALIWVLPQSIKFMDNFKANVPELSKKVFEFAQWFNEHILLASIVYFMVPVGVWMFVRSQYFVENVLDRFNLPREISLKSDQASLWTGFALLYDAGISSQESARIMRDATVRTDSAVWFDRLSKILQSGIYLHVAVENAGFPQCIVDGVKSADSSGSLVQGMLHMSNDLSEDVSELTKNLSATLDIVTKILLGAAVLGFFLVVNYPMMSIGLSSV